MFKPSVFQKAIFDYISNEDGSAIVEAVAGSGKTTTILECLKLVPKGKKVIFLAFNKSIANELEKKVPERVYVKTLNALGFAGWRRFRNGGRMNVDPDKVKKIIKSLDASDMVDDKILKRFGPSVRRLVAVAKSCGLVPSGAPEECQGLVGDTWENWNYLINHYDITFKDENWMDSRSKSDREIAIRMARTVLIENLEELDVIDFDDMLYLPVVYGAPCFKYDYLFVDEAQDVSAIQRELLRMSLRRNGRLIAVGDPAQAIYGFRGADSKSLDNIAALFNCERLPLSISYRCPKKVVLEARRFVNHIEAAENAPDGAVRRLGVYNHTMFQSEDLVVCRNTAPLIKLAYHLIGRQVSVMVLGRDIGKGIIKKIDGFGADDIPDLTRRVRKWFQDETKQLLEEDPEADLTKIEDTYEVINTFVECSGARTIEQLKSSIHNLFADKRNAVMLSTVHKSKGLEADRVFILNSFLMPSKYATQDWQIQQENNIFYVAVTRAKKELIYIDSPKDGETIEPTTHKLAAAAAIRGGLDEHLDNTVGSSNGLNLGRNPLKGWK